VPRWCHRSKVRRSESLFFRDSYTYLYNVKSDSVLRTDILEGGGGREQCTLLGSHSPMERGSSNQARTLAGWGGAKLNAFS
jgi:hypothetical protein